MVTYGELYERFLLEIGISGDVVADYRPAISPYVKHNMPDRIVIWLKNGTSLIYPGDMPYAIGIDLSHGDDLGGI